MQHFSFVMDTLLVSLFGSAGITVWVCSEARPVMRQLIPLTSVNEPVR